MTTQTLLTGIYLFWLFLVLLLLFRIWRDGTTRIHAMQITLIDMSNKAVDAAHIAAEAAHALAAEKVVVVTTDVTRTLTLQEQETRTGEAS